MQASSLRSIAAGTIAVAAIVGFSVFAALTHKVSAATTVISGDLIRGESFSAVYYMGADGYRYVFPNEKTYYTWYSNFDSVKFISDADLGNIQIGGNVTYKPGVKMIKINTDPKVYAVAAGGSLLAIDSESTAAALYGSTWNKQIDDVPDGFFSNYTISGNNVSTTEYSPATITAGATTINNDKSLAAPKEVSVSSTGFSPLSATINAGTTVRFTNSDTATHTATGDDGVWGTGTMLAGGNFVVRFKKAGTYTYYDGYNHSLSGVIYVQ